MNGLLTSWRKGLRIPCEYGCIGCHGLATQGGRMDDGLVNEIRKNPCREWDCSQSQGFEQGEDFIRFPLPV